MMNVRKKQKQKLNDQGMSLVEVMVAITILAVISTSFLKSFSMSAMVNRNAKINQDALTVAEGLMESFKAYDIDTIETQFSAATSNADFKFYDMSAGGTKGVDLSYGKYHLKNIMAARGPYDVEVVFMQTDYNQTKKDTMQTKSTIYVADSMNAAEDAVFRGRYQEESDIKDYVWDLLASQADADTSDPHFPASGANLSSGAITITDRTMTVIMEPSSVTVESTYEITLNNIEYPNTSGSPSYMNGNYTITFDKDYDTAYSSYECCTAAYDDVYLFYYPAYKTAGNNMIQNTGEDNIIIRNHSGNSDKKVYLIKQWNQPGFNLTNLGVAEGSYQPQIKVEGASVDLYHNLKVNLCDMNNENPPTSWSYASYSVIPGSVAFTDYGSEEVVGPRPVNEKSYGKLWEEKPDMTLLYTISIKVTDATTGETLITLDGSANAK